MGLKMNTIDFARYIYDRESQRKSMIDTQANFLIAVFAGLVATVALFDLDTDKMFQGCRRYATFSALASMLGFLGCVALVHAPRRWSAGLPKNFEEILADKDVIEASDAQDFRQHLLAGYHINAKVNSRRLFAVRLAWALLLGFVLAGAAAILP